MDVTSRITETQYRHLSADTTYLSVFAIVYRRDKKKINACVVQELMYLPIVSALIINVYGVAF